MVQNTFYTSNLAAAQQELLVGVSIQSVLDEDNTRQMLPDVWVMLNVTKPARHIKIFLLFLNCQVNYKGMEPVVQ